MREVPARSAKRRFAMKTVASTNTTAPTARFSPDRGISNGWRNAAPTITRSAATGHDHLLIVTRPSVGRDPRRPGISSARRHLRVRVLLVGERPCRDVARERRDGPGDLLAKVCIRPREPRNFLVQAKE